MIVWAAGLLSILFRIDEKNALFLFELPRNFRGVKHLLPITESFELSRVEYTSI